MTFPEIHTRLTTVFRDVFDNPKLEITETTSAQDIEEWDSLSHINLIVAAEKAFATSFTVKEVKALNTVGDLMRLIALRFK
ncbi:MAG: acyl carrier protein [Verrucomicrobiota bacterium]